MTKSYIVDENEYNQTTVGPGLPSISGPDIAIAQWQINNLKLSTLKKKTAQYMLDIGRPQFEITNCIAGPELDAETLTNHWTAAIADLPLPDEQKESCIEMLEAHAWDFLYSVFDDVGEICPPPIMD